MLTKPAFNILYLGINQSGNPKLKDPKVREAIAVALNRQALVDSKLPPGAEVASQFIPPTLEAGTRTSRSTTTAWSGRSSCSRRPARRA